MTATKTKIAVLGARGRMGRMLVKEISSGAFPCILGAALDKDDDAEAAFRSCDALIDFSAPVASALHAGLAARHQKPLVVGTTGLSRSEGAALEAAATEAPILYSANMSVGVNLLAALIEQAARTLQAKDYDIEIFEAHHRNKADAPSGTALMLGRAAAKGRGVNLPDAMVENRRGARTLGTIGFSVFRGGDIVGDHVVTFAGTGERIEFAHRATDRTLFVHGAIRAALWLKDQPPGLYAMKEFLGL